MRSSRCHADGRPGERTFSRVHLSDARFWTAIAISNQLVLRRPLESAQYRSEQFQRLMGDHGITCSMSRSRNVWDNASVESFFSSQRTERTARKVYRTRNDSRADVFDYIERFYNPKRRHSTLGYLSPNDFETKVELALPSVR